MKERILDEKRKWYNSLMWILIEFKKKSKRVMFEKEEISQNRNNESGKSCVVDGNSCSNTIINQ